MGKGKDSSSEASDHVSQPLSSLKDPSSFGPPPKHIHYHGAAALPHETTPDRRGPGAPLSQNQIAEQNAHYQQAIEEEAAQKPPTPPVPYRVNTTGLSTNNLPPPPVRRLDSPSAGPTSTSAPAPASAKPKPQLPPRVPPRNVTPTSHSTSSPPPSHTATQPPASQGYINQEAISRLANAGVSVPALGIGEADASAPASSVGQGANINELQSRFSQMQTNSGSSSGTHQPPTRTPIPSANREDALPPPQTFRERHADKIDMGKEKWSGVTSRFNTFVEDRKFSANANKRIPRPPGPNSPRPSSTTIKTHAPAPVDASTQPTTSSLEAQAQRKKAPPPPPPKRAEMRATPATVSPTSSASHTPPPVPVNTKPR